MTTKQCLMALMLTGLSSVSVAQNCQGLVGSAMALCLQDVGPGARRAVAETPRQESRVPAGGETARVSAPSRSGAAGNAPTSRGWNFFDWKFPVFSSSGANSGSSGSCQGLSGVAMAQCLQGVGPAVGGGGNVAVPQQGGVSAGSDTSSASGTNIVTNLRFGGTGKNCRELIGAAVAQCLQGIEPAAPHNGGAAPR